MTQQNNGTATWVRWALGILVTGLVATTGAWAACFLDNRDKIAANSSAIAAMTERLDSVKEDTTAIKALLREKK